jgi:hypothetical protein
METLLAERIGGHLPPQLLLRVFEEMQSAPVIEYGDKVGERSILAFDQLEHDQSIGSIWQCLDAWLKVGNYQSHQAGADT